MLKIGRNLVTEHPHHQMFVVDYMKKRMLKENVGLPRPVEIVEESITIAHKELVRNLRTILGGAMVF